MTRRIFLQAIPFVAPNTFIPPEVGKLPNCRVSQLPPEMSLKFEEYEKVSNILIAERLRNPDSDIEVILNKSNQILRVAVREQFPMILLRKEAK